MSRLARFAQILVASAFVAGGVTAAEGVPQPSAAEQGAAEMVRGDVATAVTAYTEALRDTGLANDRRATILNDRAVANARQMLGLNRYRRQPLARRAVGGLAQVEAAVTQHLGEASVSHE